MRIAGYHGSTPSTEEVTDKKLAHTAESAVDLRAAS
jgi:hypothetical protein